MSNSPGWWYRVNWWGLLILFLIGIGAGFSLGLLACKFTWFSR